MDTNDLFLKLKSRIKPFADEEEYARILRNTFNYDERQVFLYFKDKKRKYTLTHLAEDINDKTKQRYHQIKKKLYIAGLINNKDIEAKIPKDSVKYKYNHKDWKDLDLEGRDFGVINLLRRLIKAQEEEKEERKRKTKEVDINV